MIQTAKKKANIICMHVRIRKYYEAKEIFFRSLLIIILEDHGDTSFFRPPAFSGMIMMAARSMVLNLKSEYCFQQRREQKNS